MDEVDRLIQVEIRKAVDAIKDVGPDSAYAELMRRSREIVLGAKKPIPPGTPDYAGRAFHDKAEMVGEEIAYLFCLGDARLSPGNPADVDELPDYHDLMAIAANVLRKHYPEVTSG